MQQTLEWEVLEDFPDYAVSNMGDISNIKTGMPRKTSLNQFGIVKISLYKGKQLYTRSVAPLVAEAFCDGQSELFNTPIHLDGDRQNCCANNLMWRPRWFAVLYHRQFDSAEFHAMDVHIVDVDSGREFYSVKEACMTYGLYYNDVYRSYLNGRPTPITEQVFEFIDD